MDGLSFLSGILITVFAYSFFLDDKESEEEYNDEELEETDFSSRHVTLSCQTCRKLKRHKEIELYLFECTKCKRHVDLRSA